MHRGYIKTWRCSQDNELYFDDTFSKWQAWQDLILLANWKPGGYIKRGVKFELKRGMLAWSTKGLADRWGWSRSKVDRFLKYLENEHQIEHQKNTITTLITITNYERYQDEDIKTNIKRTSNEHQTNTSKESKESKEVNKSSKKEPFEDFWNAFDYKKGKEDARKSWDKIKFNNGLFEKIIESAKREAQNRPALITSNKTPKMAQGWLTGKRWEDEHTEIKELKTPYNKDLVF